MKVNETVNVVYSYTTKFESSPIEWASRWDVYLTMAGAEVGYSRLNYCIAAVNIHQLPNARLCYSICLYFPRMISSQIHWFAIINSLITVLLLSGQ